ncbi:hypothetical protein CEXT_637881 [Caerostris extrusa]|uniref:Uncharacterized protein n=1 Tax=Caerostris extrusa TaxID=172846 RepID=A0AAV4VGG7_CAEEX|nr:hypothetical protein CEXT_637881 [Caerostris extrusa]
MPSETFLKSNFLFCTSDGQPSELEIKTKLQTGKPHSRLAVFRSSFPNEENLAVKLTDTSDSSWQAQVIKSCICNSGSTSNLSLSSL